MTGKRLNDVVAEIVESALAGEATNARQAAVERWDDIDEDGQYIAGIEGLVARINSKSRSLKATASSRKSEGQMQLPYNLPAAVPMDLEGLVLLPTRSLSRAQVERAIQIRANQIEADRKALREWRLALQHAEPYWAEHPDWTFGQCLDAIVAADTQA